MRVGTHRHTLQLVLRNPHSNSSSRHTERVARSRCTRLLTLGRSISLVDWVTSTPNSHPPCQVFSSSTETSMNSSNLSKFPSSSRLKCLLLTVHNIPPSKYCCILYLVLFIFPTTFQISPSHFEGVFTFLLCHVSFMEGFM